MAGPRGLVVDLVAGFPAFVETVMGLGEDPEPVTGMGAFGHYSPEQLLMYSVGLSQSKTTYRIPEDSLVGQALAKLPKRPKPE